MRALTALLAFGLAAPAFAQTGREPRVHLHALGGVPLAAQDFSETRAFREFSEEGRILADYAAGRGPAFEGGVQFDFTRRWGVLAAVSAQSRDDSAAWSAELPHPLFLNRDRQASGQQGGLRHTENAAHLDLVLTFPGRRLEGTLFAGPSYVSVKAALIRAVEYRHNYPYDAVTVTGTPAASHSDGGAGFNGGGALSWKAAPRVAVRVQARYTVAKAKLRPVEGQTLDLDTGGLAVALGARFSF